MSARAVDDSAPFTCPSCGALHAGERRCADDFYQMLYWESEEPARGVVHHLTVLCYHLQHPELYSTEGLRHALELLEQFVGQGLSPEQVRRQARSRLDSGNRAWTVTAREDDHGAYDRPMHWSMTATDVVRAGPDAYVAAVRAWAEAVYSTIKARP